MQGPHQGNYREKGHINGGKTGAEERNSTKTTEGAQGGEDFITPPNSPTPTNTKAIKDQSERENTGTIYQLSDSSCSDTSDDYTAIENSQRNNTTKNKTTDKNRNSEMHSLSSSLIYDSYEFTNFANKDKKN